MTARIPLPIISPLDRIRHSLLLRRTTRHVVPDILGAQAADWCLHGKLSGESGSATALIGPPGGANALLKLAGTPQGRVDLARQVAILGRMHADERIGTWRELLPRVIATGEVKHCYCMVETRLRGGDGRRVVDDPGERDELVRTAVTTISELHRRTATVRPVDSGAITRWVRTPVALLRDCVHRSEYETVDELERALATALFGKRVAIGWLHGDYCADNVLVQDRRITGVVDWCQADPQGLVVLDIVGFLLNIDRQVERAELGQVVCSWLTGSEHPGQATVAGAQRALHADVLESRTLILLSWLLHVSNNLSQSRRYAANPLWTHRNVHAVLRVIRAL
ncbi:MAG: hypothetical protein QOI21_2769 [Actinomycetota bacterium]|jgi:hypothetical protein|nr:hypothetical protein [Actinomycetota bacterium]